MAFRKATRTSRFARVALVGASGSGKTFTALQIAKGLADGGKIAVVDTENGSAELYCDEVEFDVCTLKQFSPRDYISAINDAIKGGYKVLVIDSLSHGWMGKGGALEMVDKVRKSSGSSNSFDAWRKVTPEHNALVDALVQAPLHMVVTMRSKTEYVVEKNDDGKMVPRKVGLQPVQRDGLEYEFDIVGDMEDANLCISKSRCKPIAEAGLFRKPDHNLGEQILGWLRAGSGDPSEIQPQETEQAQQPKLVAEPQPKQLAAEPERPNDIGACAADCARELERRGLADALAALREGVRRIAGAEVVTVKHVLAAYDELCTALEAAQ